VAVDVAVGDAVGVAVAVDVAVGDTVGDFAVFGRVMMLLANIQGVLVFGQVLLLMTATFILAAGLAI
jgi:hypothetical protein